MMRFFNMPSGNAATTNVVHIPGFRLKAARVASVGATAARKELAI